MSVGRMPINGGLNPVRLVSLLPPLICNFTISQYDWHRTPQYLREIPFSLPQAKVSTSHKREPVLLASAETFFVELQW